MPAAAHYADFTGSVYQTRFVPWGETRCLLRDADTCTLLRGNVAILALIDDPHAARVDVEQTDSRGVAWTMRAYRAGHGAVFCVQAPPFPAPQGGTVEVSCAPRAVLARDLDRAGVFVTVVSPREGLDTHLVIGLARADVAAVKVTTEAGPEVTATMSDVWATAGDNGPIRAFLAVLEGPRPYVDRPLQVRAEPANGEGITSRWP